MSPARILSAAPAALPKALRTTWAQFDSYVTALLKGLRRHRTLARPSFGVDLPFTQQIIDAHT
jgi:hypothetical protein